MIPARFPSRVRTGLGRAACATLFAAVAACGGPEESLRGARQLHEEGRFPESIPLLERLLDESPGDRELNHLYGVALLAIGQPALAIWPLGKAWEAPEGELEDGLLLGRAHLDGGSAPDALAVADRLLERAPDLLEALQLRARANEALNRYTDALADVDFILARKPDEQQALILRVRLLLMLEQTEEAEAAIASAREVLASPDAAEAWKARFCAVEASFVYETRDEGHVDRAREVWEACLDEFPTDPLVVTEGVNFFEALGEWDRSLEFLRRAAAEAPENMGFRVALARRLAALGAHDEAEQTLREAAELSGGPAGWLALVEYHSDREEFAKARVAMETALEMLAPTPRIQMEYADLLIRAGAFDAAEEAIEAVDPPEMRRLLAGRLALNRGEPRRALALLSEGIRLWPGNSVARQLAAEAAEQLGDYDRAIAEYTEAVRSGADNWEALVHLAGLFEAMGRPGPMVQLANHYIRSTPRDPRGPRLLAHIGIWSEQDRVAQGAIRQLSRLPGQTEAAVMLAATLRASKDPADAVEFIAQSPLDLTRPQSVGVLGVLVENLSTLGRHQEAIARSDAAIDVHPDFAPFHELRAVALKAAGRPQEEVRQALERALALEPGRSSALIALGRLAAERGDIDESIALFDRVGASDPLRPEAAWAAIVTLLAHGRDAEIDARLERLLATRGHHAGAANLMARRIAERGGDLERAARLGRRALRFGGGAEALATLGRIQLEQGNTDAAIEALRRSVEARPDSASTRYWLGVALARSGDADGARAELDTALASEGFAEEEQARAELSRLVP